MTSLSDGHSAQAESRRQVMVVEEDPERRQRLCSLLSRHNLTVHSVCPTELAMKVQGYSGVILVGNGHARATGVDLAERIRTFDAHVPVILLGRITADSHPVSVPPAIQAYLPDEASEETLVKEIERWLKTVPEPTRRKLGQILLVDDDVKWRQILQSFLELKGFDVLTAGTGEEARQRLTCSSPRVMLLDVKMPGMDGFLTLKHIRVMYPNLPVIFTTNVDEDEAIREAEILGVQDYLVKPFNLEHLETILLTKIFT